MRFLSRIAGCVAALAMISLSAVAARAAQHNYYVTVDGRPTLTSGTYAGQANPNSGRLTLLYAHWNDATPSSNHFHGIGVYSLTGPADAPTVADTNANNRLPETYTAQVPLTLKAGAGAYAGKLVSGENGEHYSDLTLSSIHDLQAAATANLTSPEGYMYNSNAGYTNTPLTGLNLALEIVSISPGLNLGAAGLNQPGDRLAIGAEGSWPFEPVFWTDGNAAAGNYSAALRFVDQANVFGSSGTFNVDFTVVPEPASVGMALIAGLGFVVATYRFRRSK
ncbi:hypothetical protein PLANPX_2335 [Lacipirellula parvula]|uniref:PEP-CTERM protein-sorting domain-containing protein n=2 Tax=Lacipirellula parvula TaxID=2650471 RepID=A0A5K7XER8_9BACT|nr:hypothetical protein PLANPX_2335 [Lacipirellula parvula]